MTCASFAFLGSRVFSVLGHSTWPILNVTSDHLCHTRMSFVFWFENGFLQVSLAKYHCLHKYSVFTVTSIYFMSSVTTECLCKSFSFINSSVQGWIKAVLHGKICIIRFVFLLVDFKISSCKSEVIELIRSSKNRITQILMEKVVTISKFTCSYLSTNKICSV